MSRTDSSSVSVLILSDRTSTSLSSRSGYDIHTFSAPTALSQFDCFVVNITGPGIPGNQGLVDACPSSDQVSGKGFGVLSPLVRAGTDIHVSAPRGAQRRIDVYGIYPSPPECNGAQNQGSTAYYLGGQNQDLTVDTQVVIAASFSAGSNSSFSCNRWGAANSLAGPSGLSPAGVMDTQIPLTWTDNASDETGYEVEKCQGSGCVTFAPVSGSPFAANTASFTASALTASTPYRFRVRAVRGGEQSGWLTTADILTGPATPASITGITPLSTSVSISWNDSASDETGYEMERCAGTGCTSFSAVPGSPFAAGTTTHSVTGLSVSSVYRFRVRAVNGNGVSAWVSTTDVTTLAAVVAPSVLSPNGVTNSQIVIGWTDNATDETGYDVESCTGASCTGYSPVAGSPFAPNSNNFTLSGLTASTIYRVRIRAVRGAESSSWLTSGDLTTGPATPSSITNITPLTFSVNLVWVDSAVDETGYELEKCAGSGCTGFSPVPGSPFSAGTTTQTVGALTASSIYRFRVRAVNGNGVSAWVTTADVTTLAIIAAPTGLTPSGVTNNQISFAWTDNASDETSYEVESCSGASCTTFTAVTGSPFGANTTNFNLSTLNASTIYRLRVRAVRGTEQSTWLTSGDVFTGPAVPTIVSGNALASTQIGVSWVDNATDETGYEVEQCSGAGCSSYSAVAGSPFAVNSTSATVSGLTASSIYGFRVRAVNGNGVSAWVPTGNVTTLAVVSAPSAFSATGITETQITLNWSDNASDETGYDVQQCTGPSCSSFAAVTGSPFAANTVTTTITGLSGSTIYGFRIRAKRGSEFSTWLTSGDVTTAPSAPSSLSATPHSDSVALSWTDNANDETSYEIESCTGSGCSGFSPVTGSPFAPNTIARTVILLNPTTVYRFRVRSARTGVPSAWVNTGDVGTLPFLYYLYTANSGSANVSGFSITAGTGALTAVPGSPFTTTVGTSPKIVVTHPFKPFVYVLNNGSNSVSGFTVNVMTGALTAVSGSPFTAGTAPYAGTIDPSGQYLLVNNDTSGTTHVYSINQTTGVLTNVSGSPFTTVAAPEGVWVHANNYAYVCSSSANTLKAFTFNPGTGALTALSGPYTIGGTGCNGIDGKGNVILTANFSNPYNISSLLVTSGTGAITAATLSPFTATTGGGTTPTIVAMTPNGLYAYATVYPNYLLAWSVNSSTGNLTPLATPSYTLTAAANPEFVAIDQTGNFLYTANKGLNNISRFTINTGTGALTSNGNVTVGSAPMGIGISQIAQ